MWDFSQPSVTFDNPAYLFDGSIIGGLLMPYLGAQNFNEAVLTLTLAGIYIPVPSYAFMPEQITVKWQAAGGTGGIVQAQTPASGAITAAGAPITLTVSDFPMSAIIGP